VSNRKYLKKLFFTSHLRGLAVVIFNHNHKINTKVSTMKNIVVTHDIYRN